MEPTQDHIDQFVVSLLRTGFLLTDLAADLTESLPPEAFPEEDPGIVVIEMLAGSIRSVLETADPELVADSAGLIELAVDRIEEHLHLALELSKRMHADTPVRGYG